MITRSALGVVFDGRIRPRLEDMGAMMQTTFRIIAATSSLCLLFACGAPSLPASEATSESASRTASGADRFTGKTLLYYDPSHGNQIEYYAADGHCFLWYPGNRIALRGEWRISDGRLCSLYGEDTYNPVTMEGGAHWSCTDLEQIDQDVFDSTPGDIFQLSTENVPFRLPAHPRYESLSAVK